MTLPLIHKAVACVIRGDPPRLLVFCHPVAGVQLPKGTVEPGEDIGAAALRELYEESGLRLAATPEIIGTWDRHTRGGKRRRGPREVNRWHIGVIRAPDDLPVGWEHAATGSPEEEGLVFRFFWRPVDATLPANLHPLFTPAAEMLLSHMQKA